MDAGARRMLEQQCDEFYYITAMNENYAQPSLTAGSETDLLKGLYRFGQRQARESRGSVRLLGSGAILREVIPAADLLQQDFSIDSEIFSATSFSELAKDAAEVERLRWLGAEVTGRRSHVETLLPGKAPIVAATDYGRAYP